MKEIIVTPSSQVDSTLPHYIYENYSEFVEFMTAASESEERVGFGQDILQNLQKYRNFDTYKNEIVQFQVLSGTISADASELTLEDGYGFPENNGVLLIDDEIILYRTKEGNTFYELERGAPGTKVLPTFRSTGEYVETVAAIHNRVLRSQTCRFCSLWRCWTPSRSHLRPMLRQFASPPR